MKNTQKENSNNKIEDSVRLDKFLKVSRIIKRRSVAKDFCDSERVWINDRDAKASAKVKIGDVCKIKIGDTLITFKVVSLIEQKKKDDAKEMFELIKEEKIEK